jgi:glutaredoxin
MKNLIYKNDKYYLCDEISNPQGKTCMITKYIATKDNMPHTQFSKRRIVIYGRSTCPYCIGILEFLSKKPVLYKKVIFIEIDSEPSELFSKSKLLNILKNDINGHSTVPMVFDKGVFIGGSDKAKEHFTDS